MIAREHFPNIGTRQVIQTNERIPVRIAGLINITKSIHNGGNPGAFHAGKHHSRGHLTIQPAPTIPGKKTGNRILVAT